MERLFDAGIGSGPMATAIFLKTMKEYVASLRRSWRGCLSADAAGPYRS
jgi:hypothetical protein